MGDEKRQWASAICTKPTTLALAIIFFASVIKILSLQTCFAAVAKCAECAFAFVNKATLPK